MPNLSTQIRRWRLNKGLSQAQLAKQAEISRPNLINLELGRRDCTVRTLRQIATALKISPGTLLDQVPQHQAQLSRHDIDAILRYLLDDSNKLAKPLQAIAVTLAPMLTPILRAVGREPFHVSPGQNGRIRRTKVQAELLLDRKTTKQMVRRLNKLAANY